MARVLVTHNEAERWVSTAFSAGNSKLTAAFNFADVSRSVPLLSKQRLMLSTDALHYGGKDGVRLEPKQITLPGWSAAVLGRAGG
jgi:hypothetical protein